LTTTVEHCKPTLASGAISPYLANVEWRQRLDILGKDYVQPALTALVVKGHSARGFGRVEPPPFFGTKWQKDIGTL